MKDNSPVLLIGRVGGPSKSGLNPHETAIISNQGLIHPGLALHVGCVSKLGSPQTEIGLVLPVSP